MYNDQMYGIDNGQLVSMGISIPWPSVYQLSFMILPWMGRLRTCILVCVRCAVLCISACVRCVVEYDWWVGE